MQDTFDYIYSNQKGLKDAFDHLLDLTLNYLENGSVKTYSNRPDKKALQKKKERRKKKKTFEKVRAQLLFFALHNVTCQGFNCN